ncbi:flippase-like domain-containing protein [Leucobacter insecticola]|uniref:Flippase-like domain-containing protein n=1 Tax=Leucobacter insecticola TaxID=2714934 RepID=A0A6G8FL22_9MICO|nr:lysylphosphatidylglycerol synthase transmembrane domain-containing protein [Leucobacter insecticola]QIM16983.1 flippase-like domain-containing protein [Leucobacter insecticola]
MREPIDAPMIGSGGQAAPVPWHRSLRFWVSMITALVVAAIAWAAWPTMIDAFQSIRDANLWVLMILIPTQLLSFAVTGEVLFAYLRARGELRGMHPFAAMRMSLEFNFANHMLPSGGAAGITYASWKLSTLGVSPSKGTLAQIARFAVTFISFALVVGAATVWLIVSGQSEAAIVWTAVGIGVLAVLSVVGAVVLIRRRRALHRFAGHVAGLINSFGRLVRRPRLVEPAALIRFFDGLHIELRELLARPRALLAPFLWSFLVHAADAGLFWIALAAFNLYVDPALLIVAYGAATVASIIIVTPNGLGAYELVLIGLLVAGGLPNATVVAAIVVARAILLAGTIVFGWAFYQHSIATSARG